MKETLYLNNDLAIVNFSAGYATTGDQLLNSSTFSNYVHNFIDYLKENNEDLYYYAVGGKTAREAISAYGAALGVAFQIADDILDVVSDTATLGKPAGSDEEQGKSTYPALLGLEKSRELAREQAQAAQNALAAFDGQEADFLRALADYTVTRAA